MGKTILDYLAEGLQASLDEAIKQFDNPGNAKQDDILQQMNQIYDDSLSFRKLGVPLTDEYINKMQSEIEKRRNSWSI